MVSTGLSATENKSKRWSRVPRDFRQTLQAGGFDIDEHVWKETLDLISSSSPGLTQESIQALGLMGFYVSYLKHSSLSREEFKEKFARFWSNIEKIFGHEIPLKTDEEWYDHGFLTSFLLSQETHRRQEP